MMQESWQRWADAFLVELERRGLKREASAGPRRSGLLSFATNDYLGLSGHPRVVKEAALWWRRVGAGPRASALICGRTDHHIALEQDLSRLKCSESVLLFSSGYAANVGLLAALADSDLTIYSDAMNHASLIDGCRLARQMGARLEVYGHLDYEDLDARLRTCETARRLIVSDSLFSMSGNMVDIPTLIGLCQVHDAALCLDEAHATLVFGKNGGGIGELQGVASQIHFQTGTLSKAFGLQGGFVATRRTMAALLFNRARSHVFSTALPAPIAAAARVAIPLGREDSTPRQDLQSNLELFSRLMGRHCLSPIIPLPMPSPRDAIRTSRILESMGFHVPAIRPPTVPHGQALLRLSLTAAHSPEDLTSLAQVLKDNSIALS